MVTILLLLAVSIGGSLPDDGDDAVSRAMAKGGFPWYDAPHDRAKPIAPPPPMDLPDVRTGWPAFDFSWAAFGQLLVFILLAAALIALIVFLARTWNRYLERLDPRDQPRKAPATASRSAVAARSRLSARARARWMASRSTCRG